ncbi:MAG: hypothetical protein Kow0075_13150 [Salibacteraceae bacterium]
MCRRVVISILSGLLITVVISACATYYQRTLKFQHFIASGELNKALDYLDHDKKFKKDRNRFLYLVNLGYVHHLMQNFEESNRYFNEADLLAEDLSRNYASEALALITNPEVKPYRPEDFELVMVHYYKALNFLLLGDNDAAIVEARRMNLILQALDDKFKDHKRRYQRDAFAHIIIGLAYEASGEWNDAFIAYRNAYEIYSGEHGYFGLEVPEQLKDDLIKMAYMSGLTEELVYYENLFKRKVDKSESAGGQVVMFWHNGLGPVKDEFSINFFILPGGEGYVNFTNDELGLVFPFYIGDDLQKRKDLLALHVVRVAFPKYVERQPYFTSASLVTNSRNDEMEMVEDINAIAFKSLEDRFVREIGASLLRLALKKAAEVKISQSNEALGAIATVSNAITEKADTRNWQTLPHSIYYKRIKLDAGVNKAKLVLRSPHGPSGEVPFEWIGKKGRLQFQPYHSLEHLPLQGI